MNKNRAGYWESPINKTVNELFYTSDDQAFHTPERASGHRAHLRNIAKSDILQRETRSDYENWLKTDDGKAYLKEKADYEAKLKAEKKDREAKRKAALTAQAAEE